MASAAQETKLGEEVNDAIQNTNTNTKTNTNTNLGEEMNNTNTNTKLGEEITIQYKYRYKYKHNPGEEVNNTMQCNNRNLTIQRFDQKLKFKF